MKTANLKGVWMMAIALFASATMAAQENVLAEDPNYDQGWRLGFGISGGYVTDDLYNSSLGADVRLQYDINRRISVTMTTGFTNLFIGNNVPDLGFIPAKA